MNGMSKRELHEAWNKTPVISRAAIANRVFRVLELEFQDPAEHLDAIRRTYANFGMNFGVDLDADPE